MTNLKEEREAIVTACVERYIECNGSYTPRELYDLIDKAVLSYEEKVVERMRIPRITTELRTPQGGYIGSIQVISDVGFGRIQKPEMVINKMIESAIYSMVNVLMQKGAGALTLPITDEVRES